MDKKRENESGDESARELVASRVFDAPRALVWKAWTAPGHIAHWWGPRGFTTHVEEMDLRPGGKWKLEMVGPDGRRYPGENVFVEIAYPERIVFDHVSAPFFRMTATFLEEKNKTRVTMRSVFESAEVRDRSVKQHNAAKGLEQNLEKLGERLEELSKRGEPGAARPDVMVSRLFAAPKKMVFEAWSNAEHLKRWWGPKMFTTPEAEADFRAGGKFRVVMKGPDGGLYPFGGVYQEITPHDRIIFTSVIEALPDHQMITTVTFSEENGKTRLTVQQTPPSREEYARGQHQGWSESLEKLGELLNS